MPGEGTDAPLDLDAVAAVEYCYLTTTGRRSGRAHTIEIWFVAQDGCAYLMAGSHSSDWVVNLRAQPRVRLRIEEVEVEAIARPVDDPGDDRQPLLRGRMADKYGQRDATGALNSWARQALLVEVCTSSPVA